MGPSLEYNAHFPSSQYEHTQTCTLNRLFGRSQRSIKSIEVVPFARTEGKNKGQTNIVNTINKRSGVLALDRFSNMTKKLKHSFTRYCHGVVVTGTS